MNKIIFDINHLSMKIAQLMQKLNVPSFICAKYNTLHHNIVKHELNPYLNETLNIFNQCNSIKNNKNHEIIWTFWWQGQSSIPFIVRKCISSIKRHSNNHRVILITKHNINKYAKIPNYIYDKLYKGNISLTHFSDILRFNLLRNYGGLWIDSTIYCISDLGNKYFKDFYTVNVGYDKHNFTITKGKWTGFLIGGNINNSIFKFMDIFFKYYWEKNNNIVDYFMIDYVLNYAYIHNIGNFKYYVNNADIQYHVFDLMNNMENKFNVNYYNIMIKDTDFFKLTYKKKIKIKSNTFYFKFLNNQL